MWVHRFLSHQTPCGMQFSSHYILSVAENSVRILFFNEAESEQIFEFEFSNAIARSYKLTEHLLRTDKTCISYWQQLKFKNGLTDTEINHIDRMSAPEITFHYIDSNGSFTDTTLLAPKDICYTEIQACNN